MKSSFKNLESAGVSLYIIEMMNENMVYTIYNLQDI